MDSASFKKLGAVQSKALLMAGKVSAVELLEASLEVLESENPAINAVVDRPASEELRVLARAADARYRAGRPAGGIDGLTLTVKDNLWAAGMASTWGVLGGHRPAADEPAVGQVRQAGGIVVGMSNSPAFALAATTGNAVYGVTRHPLDTRLTPGGSSGGAAASVAVGMTPFALATDAGGSIRRPAAYTGVVGFKPSTAAVEPSAGFPRTAFDFQAIGALARSVADCALLTAVVATDGGSTSLSALRNDTQEQLERWADGNRLRVLLVDEPGIHQEAAVSMATESAAKALSEMGHLVTRGRLPYDVAELDGIWAALIAAGSANAVELLNLSPDSLPAGIAALARRGQAMPAVELSLAMQRLLTLRNRARLLWQGVDIVLSPTAPNFAWPHGDAFPAQIAGEPATARAAAVYATFANAVGAPSLSLPGRSDGGLPVGVQVTGAPGGDARLLALAWELERKFAG